MDVAQFGDIPGIVKKISEVILSFAGIAALAMLIVGSIKFITSSGDPKKIQEAKNALTFAIIGLLVILFSYAIIKLILYVTGVS